MSQARPEITAHIAARIGRAVAPYEKSTDSITMDADPSA